MQRYEIFGRKAIVVSDGEPSCPESRDGRSFRNVVGGRLQRRCPDAVKKRPDAAEKTSRRSDSYVLDVAASTSGRSEENVGT